MCPILRRNVPALLLALAGACTDLASAPRAPRAAAVAADATFTALAYTVEDLGLLAGGVQSFGSGINGAGDVAGYGDATGGVTHAALWVGTTVTDLGSPFGANAYARGINDSRTIVGYATDFADYYGFVWRSGSFTLLSAPHTQRSFTLAHGVNNGDEVVGEFLDPTSGFSHAFWYTAATGLVDIHPAGYAGSEAYAVSNRGEIAGALTLPNGDTHAARWSASHVVTDLGTLGGWAGEGNAINDAGAVIGESYDAAGSFLPFLWRNGRGMVAGPASGFAKGISNRGRMVGTNVTGIAVTRLGSAPFQTLPPLPDGVNFSGASGVNGCGHITGFSRAGSTFSHAVRWRIAGCDQSTPSLQ